MNSIIVLDEKRDTLGKWKGICRSYHTIYNYGFILIIDEGDYKDVEVYVNQKFLRPTTVEKPRLFIGEYIQCDIRETSRGLQAYNVTGINGGPLMCDVIK